MFRELKSTIKNLPRHTVNAFQSIIRNGIMSVSSIFAVSITLLLIGVITVIAVNIQQMTVDVEESITIYVKLDRNASDEQVAIIAESISKIEQVKDSSHSPKDKELDKLIEYFGEDGKLFEDYREDQPLGDAFVVDVINSSYLQPVAEQIKAMDGVRTVNYGGQNTVTLIDALKTLRNGGSIFVVALFIVAVFLISNTIKITINARSVEISIMRMVGASNWFIRTPFMLEGVIIGLIGCIVPVAIIYFGYTSIYAATSGVFISGLLKVIDPTPFIWQISGVMALVGAGVGLVGSFLSVGRFLKL